MVGRLSFKTHFKNEFFGLCKIPDKNPALFEWSRHIRIRSFLLVEKEPCKQHPIIGRSVFQVGAVIKFFCFKTSPIR